MDQPAVLSMKPDWAKQAKKQLVAEAGMDKTVAAAVIELVAKHVAADLEKIAYYFDTIGQTEMSLGIRTAAHRLELEAERSSAEERIKTKKHKGWRIDRE